MSSGQVFWMVAADTFSFTTSSSTMIDGYVPAQHEHNSPHRSTTDDYIPAQHEHNSPH